MTDEFSPDFIIPFKYGREEAIKKFYSWCKGGRWTPFDFISDKKYDSAKLTPTSADILSEKIDNIVMIDLNDK